MLIPATTRDDSVTINWLRDTLGAVEIDGRGNMNGEYHKQCSRDVQFRRISFADEFEGEGG